MTSTKRTETQSGLRPFRLGEKTEGTKHCKKARSTLMVAYN